MILEMTRGCICDSLTVDNKAFIDFSEQEKNQFIQKIIPKLDAIDSDWYTQFIKFLLETYGDYNCSEKPCETCGDYIENFKLEL